LCTFSWGKEKRENVINESLDGMGVDKAHVMLSYLFKTDPAGDLKISFLAAS
jgi:hypothetical protein